MKKNYIVAVDGPAASGKSTIAKKVADILDLKYIDSGAMFRAITHYVLDNHMDIDDQKAISKSLDNISLSYDKNNKLLLNGKDIESEIRKNIISQNVSKVAINPDVRNFLLEFQRNLAKEEKIIMDGRDIGTAVFPDAKYKFFLIASSEERANRRYKELKNKGENVNYNDILEDILKRDKMDSTRNINPLTKASDAIEIDSTTLGIDEVVNMIVKSIKNKED